LSAGGRRCAADHRIGSNAKGRQRAAATRRAQSAETITVADQLAEECRASVDVGHTPQDRLGEYFLSYFKAALRAAREPLAVPSAPRRFAPGAGRRWPPRHRRTPRPGITDQR
jgi:hypothetical protein